MPFWMYTEAFILKLRTKPTKKETAHQKETYSNNWKILSDIFF